jgi:hypothetical protein
MTQISRKCLHPLNFEQTETDWLVRPIPSSCCIEFERGKLHCMLSVKLFLNFQYRSTAIHKTCGKLHCF